MCVDPLGEQQDRRHSALKSNRVASAHTSCLKYTGTPPQGAVLSMLRHHGPPGEH